MNSWFSGLSTEIKTALIAALATLTGIIIKDVIISRWNDLRRERKDALNIYRSYADPLASAALSLFRRLRETLLEEGRGNFLKSSGKATQFERYKYESTLYRIAVLIGWLRAYRRELTLFSLDSPDKLRRLRNSIWNFESALADGAHVEAQRIQSLAALWHLSLPQDQREISALGVAVEQIVMSTLHSNHITIANNLDSAKQLEICTAVANKMASQLKIKPLLTNVVKETVGQAIHFLSVREAWLYRDFQSGIGDLMIQEVSNGTRRFEVVGFAEFEKFLLSDDPDIRRWIERINRIIDGLDVSGADRFDARVQMLEEMFLATINFLEALAEIDPRRGVVSEDLLEQMKALEKDDSWRKSVRRN